MNCSINKQEVPISDQFLLFSDNRFRMKESILIKKTKLSDARLDDVVINIYINQLVDGSFGFPETLWRLSVG